MSQQPRPIADILADYVPNLPPGQCWPWKGHKDRSGYGVINRSAQVMRAHRFVYEALVGPIPKGKLLMHSCDNPPCVNPHHLTPGTDAENIADSVAKRRHTFGERMWSAKLTEEQVVEARLKFESGRHSQHALAQEYGISDGPMWQLLHGLTWKYLPHAAPLSDGVAKGSRSPWAKLTESTVMEIRRKYATGEYKQSDLANEYGLTPTPMSQLLRGITWKHLPVLANGGSR